MPNRSSPTLPPIIEAYRQPSRQRLGLYAGLYAMLVLTAVLGRGRRGELNTLESLRRSSLVRTMFADIGALSTLGALYLALRGRTKLRFVGAALTLFVGSFALIPTLAWEDWVALRERGEEAGDRPMPATDGQ